MFEALGRNIEARIEDGLLCRGNADELREVVVNLLDNALVHGAGTVQVSLQRSADGIALEVADQGPGVPVAEQEAMFQRFRKGRQSNAGTGLGLAIVRRIVENAGGRVWFLWGAGVLRGWGVGGGFWGGCWGTWGGGGGCLWWGGGMRCVFCLGIEVCRVEIRFGR